MRGRACSHLLVVRLSCLLMTFPLTSAIRPSVGMVTVSLSHLPCFATSRLIKGSSLSLEHFELIVPEPPLSAECSVEG